MENQYDQNQEFQRTSQINTEQDATINVTKYDYFGQRLASGYSDGSIVIYDALKENQFQQLWKIQAHDGPVLSLAWSHPKYRSLIASAGFDGKINVWKDQQLITSFNDHQGYVNCVQWYNNSSGLFLLAVGSDGKVSIRRRTNDDQWNNVIMTTVSALALTSLDCFSQQDYQQEQNELQFVAGCMDNVAYVCSYDSSTEQFQIKNTLKGHVEQINDVATKTVLGDQIDQVIATGSSDQTVNIWTINGQNEQSHQILRFDGSVQSVDFSSQQNILAVSFGNNQVKIFSEDQNGNWNLAHNIN